MNNTRLQEVLIDNFKKEMKEKLGKGVKIMICNKWESEANFTDKLNMWAVIQLVFDYTGWDWRSVYVHTPYKGKGGAHLVNGLRKGEKVFRRSLIDFILVNNGLTLMECARETLRKGHDNIIHSIGTFQNRLETEYYVQKMFLEIMTYIKENYYLYKDKTTLKTGVIGE